MIVVVVTGNHRLIASSSPHRFLDYSTLGVVIGHEIAHSFDVLARKDMQDVDSGNVTRFWSHEMHSKYESMTKCFADQFSNFTISSIGQNVSDKNLISLET